MLYPLLFAFKFCIYLDILPIKERMSETLCRIVVDVKC